MQIIDQFESDDGTRVVTRLHSCQRYAADLFGVAASGRVILFGETHVVRLVERRPPLPS